MKIDLERIPPEGLRINAKEPASVINVKDESAVFENPIEVSVLASKTRETLIVSGDIKTTVELKCGRCLNEFNLVLENSDFNCTRDIRGLKEIDITDNIREEIIILLPLKPLCSEDCKGIIQKPKIISKREITKKQDKEDPRWSELDKFKLK